MADAEKQNRSHEAEMQRAIAVAAHVEIADVQLVELTCHNDIELPLTEPLDANLRSQATGSYDHSEERLHVIAQCEMEASLSEREPPARRATGVPTRRTEERAYAKATYRLVYDLPPSDEWSQDDFDAFAHVNGLFNLWPYWRELVQTITFRMGLPPLVLPVRRGVPSAKAPPED